MNDQYIDSVADQTSSEIDQVALFIQVAEHILRKRGDEKGAQAAAATLALVPSIQKKIRKLQEEAKG